MTMVLSRPFKEDRLELPLSTPLSTRRSTVWCPWLCARRLCLKFLYASDLQWGLLCPPVYLLGRLASLWHVQGSTLTGVFEGGCRPSTHSSLGFPIYILASSVMMIACQRSDSYLLIQSSGGHGWLLPPPLSSWRLRPYRLHCLHGCRFPRSPA